ncbi:MAG: tRNA (adenosine(37)-N6)-threonylcarbamoyltransferase complex dimerization subunit type 1 TsaB [Nitrospinales bacterium]
MKILGVDSSSPDCSVALLENNKILSQHCGNRKASFSDQLLPMVDEVLSSSNINIENIDGFAVTNGPGSFTGLRVGLSLVKGLVLVTEKPFVGVDTLEALASLIPKTDYQVCPLLDARKSEVYCAMFAYEENQLTRITENSAIKPENLCKTISRPTIFIGSGLITYRQLLIDTLGELFIEGKALEDDSVAASASRLAFGDIEKKKNFDLSSLKINYVRKSEAELNYTGHRQL